MGDVRKLKKLYSKPKKMWDANRLSSEKPIIKEFGLKNKQELWKISSTLKKYTHQAKRIIASRTTQSDVEAKQVISRLASLGVVKRGASINDVLGLTLNEFMGRRLSTLVFRKKLARSVKQARQFIVHRHIAVGNKVITSPSYLVPVNDEVSISFVENSTLASAEHPERALKEVKEVPDPENAKE
jgi:small subunit ribosomal protein S4